MSGSGAGRGGGSVYVHACVFVCVCAHAESAEENSSYQKSNEEPSVTGDYRTTLPHCSPFGE